MKSIRKITYLGLCLGIALIIFAIEAQIPVFFPGMKLGLANSVSLFLMYTMGPTEALIIMILRTFLGSVFAGNLFGFVFSLAGGLVSNLAMIALKTHYKEDISIISISVAGGVFHNVGQLLAAATVISDFKIFIYFPLLMASGMATGAFVGIVVNELVKRIK
ncbi:heptaprenyl diphosphate synthase [Hathewaya proteolytica DSM 3090]|uniref:Heptaprenyl diphosphate synthase n=1 Tax=Hathewaya proteolytica DSM 3090 TaxID=1121331 RepID=A0A1M6RSZ5_9CLOT|nr:Gx transporter family protein [Hathewaya proteolytica]SHK35397.1 heptaprenyl diphosphate synthase [Hathewaya proteolytica DSM 3090]